MTPKLATSIFALTAVCASPAFADVTAQDVWANQQALFTAMGGTLSGELADDGTVSPELNFILPDGAASMQIKAGPITLTDNDDGTVTVTYPSPFSVTVAGGAPDEGTFTLDMVMTHSSYTSVANGNPGDIAYDTSADNIRIEVTNLTMDNGSDEEVEMTGILDMSSWISMSRITEGNVIAYSSQSTTGASSAEFQSTIDDVVATSTQTTLPLETAIAASLPAGGSDLMNLSQATRNGLSIALESSGEGSTSATETRLNGDILNSQSTETGEQTFALVFDESGLVMNADADGFALTMNDPMVLPQPIDFAIDAVAMNLDLPLNASTEAQDFRVATSLTGIAIGDVVWDMFDPAGELPRDPADISFDITGIGTNGMDLLDFASMTQMAGPPPVQVDEVTIQNLRIAAVGAEATARGSMTFDWTDFSTIPGMPRPEGQVTVNLNGANQLMDRLAAMGMIAEQDLMMPRMMMGMFATPVGDDMLESVIEVNEQGHVLANGQRLQ